MSDQGFSRRAYETEKLVILGAKCWWNLVPTYYSTPRVFEGWWHGWHFAQYDSDGDPNVFNVNRDDDELWLNTNDGRPDNEWNPGDRFVFLRPRKSHHALQQTALTGGLLVQLASLRYALTTSSI